MSGNLTMTHPEMREFMELHGRTYLNQGSRIAVQNFVDELSSLLDKQTASLEDLDRMAAAVRAQIKDTRTRLKKAQADLERIDSAPEPEALELVEGAFLLPNTMSERDLTEALHNDELSTSEKIRRVARYVLERAQPLKRRSLLKAVSEAGLVIEAADPADTLRKALERDSDFSKNAHGYWLSHSATSKAAS